jgi:ABC-type amino acid transport system permease subunit
MAILVEKHVAWYVSLQIGSKSRVGHFSSQWKAHESPRLVGVDHVDSVAVVFLTDMLVTLNIAIICVIFATLLITVLAVFTVFLPAFTLVFSSACFVDFLVRKVPRSFERS